MISLSAVSFSYDDSSTLVFEDLNFGVEHGEFVAVLGASGVGKTTLLHVIAGFRAYDSGSVTIDGNRVDDVPGTVGFIFQEEGLFPWKTIRGNMLSGATVRAKSPDKQDEIAHSLADTMGLDNVLDHYPHQLSGGMAQRAEVARAVANDPKVLLMDEPFNSLDAQRRHALQFWLQDIWTELGITIVFVTHDIEEALLLADRIVILQGQPADIDETIPVPYDRPRTIDVVSDEDFASQRSHIYQRIQSVEDTSL
jgi:NitT/TauT family transport system ATP-binding protein